MMVALSALELVQGLHDVLNDVILLRHLALYLLPLHLSHGVVDGAEQPVDLLDNALTTHTVFQQGLDLKKHKTKKLVNGNPQLKENGPMYNFVALFRKSDPRKENGYK